MAGYLARLAARLDRETWIPRERDDNSGLVSRTSVQQPLTVRLEKDPTRVKPVGELAASCDRFVILGGPGAGRTWAVRSVAAHAAEVALERLTAGAGLEDLELPLFARCPDVLQRGVSSRWDEAINASLNWADDGTPGDRPILTHALGGHPRLLLILDGLDETTDLDGGQLSSVSAGACAVRNSS